MTSHDEGAFMRAQRQLVSIFVLLRVFWTSAGDRSCSAQVCRPVSHAEFLELADQCDLSSAQLFAASDMYFAYLESARAIEFDAELSAESTLFPDWEDQQEARISSVRAIVGRYRAALTQQEALDRRFFDELVPILSDEQAVIVDSLWVKRAMARLASSSWMKAMLRQTSVADLEGLLLAEPGIDESSRQAALEILRVHDREAVSLLQRMWDEALRARIELELAIAGNEREVDFDQVNEIYSAFMRVRRRYVENRQAACEAVCDRLSDAVGRRIRLMYLARCDVIGVGLVPMFLYRLDELQRLPRHGVDISARMADLESIAEDAFLVSTGNPASLMIGNMNLNDPDRAERETIQMLLDRAHTKRRAVDAVLFTPALNALSGSTPRDVAVASDARNRARSELVDPPPLVMWMMYPAPSGYVPLRMNGSALGIAEDHTAWVAYSAGYDAIRNRVESEAIVTLDASATVMSIRSELAALPESARREGMRVVRECIAEARRLDEELLANLVNTGDISVKRREALTCERSLEYARMQPRSAFLARVETDRAHRFLVQRRYELDIIGRARDEEWPLPVQNALLEAICENAVHWQDLSGQVSETVFRVIEAKMDVYLAYNAEIRPDDFDERRDVQTDRGLDAERAKGALSRAFFAAIDSALLQLDDDARSSAESRVERCLWPETYASSDDVTTEIMELIANFDSDAAVATRTHRFLDQFELLCGSIQDQYCTTLRELETIDPLDSARRSALIRTAQLTWEDYLNLWKYAQQAISSGRLLADFQSQ